MCLIVDVNVAHRILLKKDDPDYYPIHQALFSGTSDRVDRNQAGCHTPRTKGIHSKLVFGGRLAEEYARSGAIQKIVVRLLQAGKARRVSGQEVEAETQRLEKRRVCKSDDPHIIALATVGKVRLLCTDDTDLMRDFRKKDLIDKPRGKIYSNVKHQQLIGKFCDCS
jgi:hypothetical protein